MIDADIFRCLFGLRDSLLFDCRQHAATDAAADIFSPYAALITSFAAIVYAAASLRPIRLFRRCYHVNIFALYV